MLRKYSEVIVNLYRISFWVTPNILHTYPEPVRFKS